MTPSLNQAVFLDACMRSVLNEDYDRLEYIIIDGGSTDGSVDVIRKHESRLAYWQSASDRGQAHAINIGLARSTGDVVAYLNADDMYDAGALHAVGAIFGEHPEVGVVFGDAEFVDEAGHVLRRYHGIERPFAEKLRYWRGWSVPQPTVFLRRRVLERHGFLDETFSYALDFDWFLRMSTTEQFHHAGRVLAYYRRHSQAKTGDWETTKARFFVECRRAVAKHLKPASPAFLEWWGAYLVDRLAEQGRAIPRLRRRGQRMLKRVWEARRSGRWVQ